MFISKLPYRDQVQISGQIGEVPKTAGSKLRLGGRITRINDTKNIAFLWLRDSTGIIQITAVKEKTPPDLLKQVSGISINDFIIAEGVVPEQIRSNTGSEMILEKITVVGKALEPSPIDIEKQIESAMDKRLDWRALDLRDPKHAAIFNVQSSLLWGLRKFFSSEGVKEVFTPSLMGTPSEGGSEVFSLEHFGKTAYLRQDPQLHRQFLMLAGFDKIYEIGPSWRAELSNTPRHLTEHRTCASEISFIKDERDVIKYEQKAVISAVKSVIKNSKADLELLGVTLEVPKRFPELKFPKIYDILEELGSSIERGTDYNKAGESLLAKYVKEKYNTDFFFVNRFPFAVKPFYVMRVDEDPEWARSIDLIYKGVELSSGGQREHRYEKIISQAKEKGMNPENIKWFTDLFKYGAPPHGGFSIGIERLTMQILNIQNVRETVLFPRAPDRLLP